MKVWQLTMNSKKQWRKFEVNEEYDDSKIHQSMWCWYQVRFLVKHEDDWRNDWRLGVARIKSHVML